MDQQEFRLKWESDTTLYVRLWDDNSTSNSEHLQVVQDMSILRPFDSYVVEDLAIPKRCRDYLLEVGLPCRVPFSSFYFCWPKQRLASLDILLQYPKQFHKYRLLGGHMFETMFKRTDAQEPDAMVGGKTGDFYQLIALDVEANGKVVSIQRSFHPDGSERVFLLGSSFVQFVNFIYLVRHAWIWFYARVRKRDRDLMLVSSPDDDTVVHDAFQQEKEAFGEQILHEIIVNDPDAVRFGVTFGILYDLVSWFTCDISDADEVIWREAADNSKLL